MSTSLDSLHIGTDCNNFVKTTSFNILFWWPNESARFLELCTRCLVSNCSIPSVHLPCWFFGSLSLVLFKVDLLGLRTNPELCFKGSESSFCISWPSSRLDALFLSEFPDLHLLLFSHGVPDCLKVLFTPYFPCEGRHFRPHWLTSGSCNTDRLHGRAFLHDHLAQIDHTFLVGPKQSWPQSPNQYSWFIGENADLSAIVHSTVEKYCKAFHDGMLFLVECNILVSIPPFLLTICYNMHNYCANISRYWHSGYAYFDKSASWTTICSWICEVPQGFYPCGARKTILHSASTFYSHEPPSGATTSDARFWFTLLRYFFLLWMGFKLMVFWCTFVIMCITTVPISQDIGTVVMHLQVVFIHMSPPLVLHLQMLILIYALLRYFFFMLQMRFELVVWRCTFVIICITTVQISQDIGKVVMHILTP